MDMDELKTRYKDLLQPVFGERFRIDDSDEDKDWVVILLDGKQGNFYFSLYGTDCARLYWCGECFIFDKRRNDLVSSDTYDEIVYEADFDVEQLPFLITDLILQLKDCTYIAKEERLQGKIPSGYDDVKDYVITARAENCKQPGYQLANITIQYIM